jgi:hypothetical protein
MQKFLVLKAPDFLVYFIKRHLGVVVRVWEILGQRGFLPRLVADVQIVTD